MCQPMFLWMPACSSNRLDVALHEIVRPVGLFASHGRTGKDPIVVHRVRALTTPTLQVLRHILSIGTGLADASVLQSPTT